MRKVDYDKVENLVKDGTIFTVTFIKRTTGETRVMNARKGVKKDLKGGTLKYDPKERRLLTCWEVPQNSPNEGRYKMIDVNSIITLKAHGKTYDRNDLLEDEG